MRLLNLCAVSGAMTVMSATLALAASDQTLSPADKTFLMTTGRGSVYELELSKLAQSTAHDARVKQYAEMVVGDHSKADEKFRELAEKYDLTVPTTLSQNDRTALDKVKQLSGPDFDQAYLQQMKLINQEDIKAEQQEISTTSVTRLKSFVQTMQNGDEKHNRDAERISSNG